MTSLVFLALAAASTVCPWQEPSVPTPLVRQGPGGPDDLRIFRPFGSAWGRCAAARGGKQSILRVTADDGEGPNVILQMTLPFKAGLGLDEPSAMLSIREGFRACPNPEPNQRSKRAVLSGPVGQRRFMNPRRLTIELLAEGPLAPLAFRTQVDVLCPACSSARGAEVAHTASARGTAETRFSISVSKERYACAEGGGRMLVRRYWVDRDDGEGRALHPYEIIDNVQDKLRLKDGRMVYESFAPGARFCKKGQRNVWEVIGLDEYAAIVTSGFGPTGHVVRGQVTGLDCK